ncbi:MAG: dhaR [Deltaproteobacteria bacterium]|nr:dhaR [Deltaproteobacteria bacterium]
MEASTKQRLLEAGMAMLLEHGYNHLGIQQVLAATSVPKGSFYHHFKSKEDFALQVIDQYMVAVHGGLDACLGDLATAPLQRVRRFFENTLESYRQDGYLGCLLGGLGQELSGINEVFRHRIERCFSEIAVRVASCLEEAIQRGELLPDTKAPQLANLLVDCWEGAALRTRLLRDPAPLQAMLDFYFQSMMRSDQPSPPSRERSKRRRPRPGSTRPAGGARSNKRGR